jgi:hypothetical protein
VSLSDSDSDNEQDDDSDIRESRSDADAGERDDIGKFRRQGVPANAMVERQGDVWRLATDQEITEPWRQLFLVRLRLLGQLGLFKHDFLPLPQQKQAFVELQAWWEGTPQAQIQHRVIRSRYRFNEQINRNWRSSVKAAMFNMFGGQLWVRLAIALGTIDRDMVRIINDIIAEKIRARESRDPALSPTRNAQVRPRESDTTRPPGVQHRVSKAKCARQAAKWYLRKVQREMVAWGQGYGSSMTWAAWEQLRSKAQDPCSVVCMFHIAGVPLMRCGAPCSAVSYICFTLHQIICAPLLPCSAMPCVILYDSHDITLYSRMASPCIVACLVAMQCHVMPCCCRRRAGTWLRSSARQLVFPTPTCTATGSSKARTRAWSTRSSCAGSSLRGGRADGRCTPK